MVAKRLQVILPDPDYRETQRAARSRKMSIAEWVRPAPGFRAPLGEVEKKLAAVRAAEKREFPTGDVESMLAEIEQGYLTDRRS